MTGNPTNPGRPQSGAGDDVTHGEPNSPSARLIAPDQGPQELRSSATTEAVRAVERFLAAGPQPGSLIASYLETELSFRPRFRGYQSLTHFLQQTLGPRLRVVSSRGTDHVWQLDQFGGNKDVTTLGAGVWRALASPNSLRKVRVYVHTHTGEWRLTDANDEDAEQLDHQMTLLQPGAWQHLMPMPAEEHIRLARRFAKRQDLGVLGTALRAVIERDPANWLQTWRYLLADHAVHQQSWLDHRDAGVQRYVGGALRAAGLTDDAIAAALHHIGDGAGKRGAARSEYSIFAVKPASEHPVRTTSASATTSSASSAPTGEELRAALQHAIARLSYEELQRVLVPASALVAMLRQPRA